MADDPFVRQLADEVIDWRSDGIVDAATARSIRRRYGIAQPINEMGDDDERVGHGRTTTIIGSLGSILVGLGVILFVASNWQGIDRPVKLAILLGALTLSSSTAFLLRGHGRPRIGAAVMFLSELVFGANIFLVGQMYHVRSSEPFFLLLWVAGILPVAYLATSRLTLFVALAALLGWFGMLLGDWHAWGHPLVAPAFLAAGLLIFGIGGILGQFTRTAPLATVTRVVGLLTAFPVIFLLTFSSIWSSAGQALSAGLRTAQVFPTSVALLFVAATVALVASAFLRRSNPIVWAEATGSLVVLAATGTLVLVPPLPSAQPYAVIFNIIAMLVVIGTVVLGIGLRQESLVNLSLALFAAVVMARYFDIFGSMMQQSLVFIGAGLLLLIGGFLLERSRRFLNAQSLGQSLGMELEHAR